MSYIGSTPTTQSFIAGTDYFNGDGTTVNFTLSRSVNSVNDIEVIVNNVEQIPSGYSVSGTTLTFSAAPSAGTSNVYVRYLSTTNLSLAIPAGTSATFNTVTVADGSATTPSITNDGDTNTGIFFPAADTIAFAEGGAEVMRINSSGFVGIGTTTPTRALSVVGTWTNTGDYLMDSSDPQLAWTSGTLRFKYGGLSGTEAARFDSSGNFMVGTTTANTKFVVGATTTTGAEISAYTTSSSGGTSSSFSFWRNYTGGGTSPFRAAYISNINVDDSFNSNNAQALGFYTKSGTSEPAERARIDSSGNFLVNQTALNGAGKVEIAYDRAGSWGMQIRNTTGTTQATTYIAFKYGSTQTGYIESSGTNTTYNTSSDYRLKEDIAPMTGALEKIALIRPVTYKWKSTGEADQGFIAHELAEVCPSAVSGAKDAVETYIDENGNEATRPVYQGIDTSFLVATLTAAIQELKAIVDAQGAEIAALKGTP